ncbi:hypothetical protein FB107DRAFT_217328, partial [Schizophyllum commune]
MSSLPRAPSPDPPDATVVDSSAPGQDTEFVALMKEAIARYEAETSTKLDSSPYTSFDSAAGIFAYIQENDKEFRKFRTDGPQWLRKKVEPVAATVQTFCEAFGEAVTEPHSPFKAVFAAMSVLIKAAMQVKEDYNAVVDAFDTIGHYLRIIQPIASADMNHALREASVRLLAQILATLGMVTKLQQRGRFKQWLKKLRQSREVSSALGELGRLAANHHQAVGAVTLNAVNKMMGILVEGSTGDKEDKENAEFTGPMLKCIVQVAQDIYSTGMLSHRHICSPSCLAETSVNLDEQVGANRQFLEGIQNQFLLHVEAVERRQRRSDVDDIFRWLKYPDGSIKMNELQRTRAPSTGSWFLDGEAFASFKRGRIQVLWLHGSAGSGKSTILASAIRDLEVHRALCDAEAIVLRHLFDVTNGSQSRDIRALLSSLLCQLAHARDDCRTVLAGSRAEHKHGHEQPSIESMRYHLDMLLDNSDSRIFIVVDALDETDDKDVVALLESLRTRPNVSFLISSRAAVLAREKLERLADVELDMTKSPVANDIASLLDQAFTRGGTLEKIRDVDFVRESLSVGADGNFRWVLLQMKELEKVAGIPHLVRIKLSQLPKTLHGMYEYALDQIPKEARDVVHRLLMWLLFAPAHLEEAEFAELVAFEFLSINTIPIYDPMLRASSPGDALALIGSTFLSCYHSDDAYEEYNQVQISHASVRDFLLGLPTCSPFYIDVDLSKCLM